MELDLASQQWSGSEATSAWLARMDEFQKALTAGSGTDAASYTGGRALQPESLERLLITTTFEDDDYVLWRELNKSNLKSTVDQWVDRTDYGARWGAAVGERDNPAERTATLARITDQAKFLRTYRDVSHVATIVDTIVEATAEEEQAGTRWLLEALTLLMYQGNSAVIPEEFDGIYKQVVAKGDSDQVIDVYNHTEADTNHLSKALFNTGARLIRDNHGRATHLFNSTLDQADIDNLQDTKERTYIPITGTSEGIILGSPAAGINTSYGLIKFNPDIFNEPGEIAPDAATAGVGVPSTPVLNSLTAQAATGTPGFITAWAGTYKYRVAAVNKYGRSAACAAQTAAVINGQEVAINVSMGATVGTGYLIYRSDPAVGAGTITRLIRCEFPFATGTNDVYDDNNADLPGTTMAFMLNLKTASRAMDWRQLLPLMKLPLAITQPSLPFLIMLYGFLRMMKPRQHVVYKNIVPEGVEWHPLTGPA